MFIAFFRLVRWPNLLMILLTQYLIKICVIDNMLSYENLSFPMGHFMFALLVLSTILVASAGYVLNDIEDVDIDEANKADKIIIGKYIKKESAYILYYVLNITGLLLASFSAYSIGKIELVGIHIFTILLLYVYSLKYKCSVLTGNLIVSFLVFLIPLLVWVYLVFGFYFISINSINIGFISWFVWMYAIFAFISNLVREIFKDIEDKEGDQKENCITMAGKYSTKTLKVVSKALLLLLVALILYFEYKFIRSEFNLYVSSLILIVLAILVKLFPKISKAKSKEDFKELGKFMKALMVGGLALLLLLLLH